jgi:hypothetical protein
VSGFLSRHSTSISHHIMMFLCHSLSTNRLSHIEPICL